MKLLSCAAYYALTGFMLFLAGRFIPKCLINPSLFPYRMLSFEKDGVFYEKLGVKSWQHKLPDMSRTFCGIMPAKALPKIPDSEHVLRMIKETCIAELIHALLMLFGLGCFKYFTAKTAIFVYVIFFLCNLPYIIVQRYNRPRLIKLLKHCKMRELSLQEEAVAMS